MPHLLLLWKCYTHILFGQWLVWSLPLHSAAILLWRLHSFTMIGLFAHIYKEIGWMEALSDITNMAGIGHRDMILRPGINLNMKWTEWCFITLLREETEIMNTVTLSSLRMRERNDDWWEQIVQWVSGKLQSEGSTQKAGLSHKWKHRVLSAHTPGWDMTTHRVGLSIFC